MIQNFIGHLAAKVGEKVMEECGKMGAGQCADMEDYAGRVGYIRGLNAGVAFAKELLKASTQDADDMDMNDMPVRRVQKL